ncbi:MAG: Negative regulator of mitotic exit [Phylliscum demangeonii]|nr:MAG: Negative regulator of mitotic exit [Phylliscum demangeonii]
MAFLFKSKKHNPSSAIPTLSKDASAPVSAASGASPASSRDREKEAGANLTPTPTPTPSSSVNNSLSSVTGNATPSPEHRNLRPPEKAEPDFPGLRTALAQPPAPALSTAALYPWAKARFNFTTNHPNPFPRYGAAVNAVASKEGDIYMMGGLINGSTVKGDLWMVEADPRSLACYPIVTTSEGPGPRVGHASLIVGNAFIVFGGDTKIDERDVLDDTLYLLNTATRQWSRAAPPGPRPAGRYGHTLNIIGSKLYVFGGQVEGYFFNDVVAFDLNALQIPNNQWEILIPNSAEGGPPPGQVPPARTNHTVVNWQEKLFLFGGTDGVQWFNDVWTFDPRTNRWSQLDFIGHIPLPREGHAAALVGDVMYIFGGRTEEGNDLGDLAAFRISTKRWYTFQNMGPSPSPRSGHSMTAHGKQILVIGGEPSLAPRDEAELSMLYLLDTGKIQYPMDPAVPTPTPAVDRLMANRRPSAPDPPPARAGTGRDGSVGAAEARRIGGVPSRESVLGSSPAGAYGRLRVGEASGTAIPMNGPTSAPTPTPGAGPGPVASRLPRAAGSQAPSGPPPPQQAPPPRTNGVLPAPPAPRSKTPTRAFSPGLDPTRIIGSIDQEAAASAAVGREGPPPTTSELPVMNGRRTPTLPPPRLLVPAKEVVEEPRADRAAPARSRSLLGRPQPQPVPPAALRVGSPSPAPRSHGPPPQRRRSDEATPDALGTTPAPASGIRAVPEEPSSTVGTRMARRRSSSESGTVVPYLRQQNETLAKELLAAKHRNAWFASEIAAARRAGYGPSGASSASPALDEKAAETTAPGTEDASMFEDFLLLRAELDRVRRQMETQAVEAAATVAEAERQRDAAVHEAVYAKTKLVAHGGGRSPASTPQPDGGGGDVGDDDDDRMADAHRKLSASLSAQTELHARLSRLQAELASERQARQVAEQMASAAEGRISELDSYQQRHSSELERLRAELHAAQKLARADAAQGTEAHAAWKLAQAERDELSRRLEAVSATCGAHAATVGSMRDAVRASTDKARLLEQQLEEERRQREHLDRKLRQLRAEHEEMTAELDTGARRLRDAEDLLEAHAAEAKTHRDAVLAGLEPVVGGTGAGAAPSTVVDDERVAVLRTQVETTTTLARQSQAAADAASEKLRGAEERIAGLEAYQEQSSREGLALRRQLQVAHQQTQALQADNADVRAQLAHAARDANAITVQHGALKELLAERGLHPSSEQLHRSRSQSRAGAGAGAAGRSGSGTPDDGSGRLRELEQRLDASQRALAAAAASADGREHDAERVYRDKLEQLENDYQAAVQYVKGTEKMLKLMKDELGKYQAANGQLQTELAAAKALPSSDAGRWPEERGALQRQIASLETGVQQSIAALEAQLHAIRAELDGTRRERDAYRHTAQQAEQALAVRADGARRELEQLTAENTVLEGRAHEAEKKVAVLLDQVVTSVDNYRRQSRQHLHQMQLAHPPPPLSNGVVPAGAGGAHRREISELSARSEDSAVTADTTSSASTAGGAGGVGGGGGSGGSTGILDASMMHAASLTPSHLSAGGGGLPPSSHPPPTTTTTSSSSNSSSSTFRPLHDMQRNSLALDTLASELETLRSHWESTNKAYNSHRLSTNTLNLNHHAVHTTTTTATTTPRPDHDHDADEDEAEDDHDHDHDHGSGLTGLGMGMGVGMGVAPAAAAPSMTTTTAAGPLGTATATGAGTTGLEGAELSSSLANWRRRLDLEEQERDDEREDEEEEDVGPRAEDGHEHGHGHGHGHAHGLGLGLGRERR